MSQPTNQSASSTGWSQYFTEGYQSTVKALKHEDCITKKLYNGANSALFGKYGLWTHKGKVVGHLNCLSCLGYLL
ncbi:unnamed protein product [marine sediment metagenome]|uniref:Uncharacterized protein n=1 Tax=marine sediment metagenome TaxID=412755 RepID=X1CH98_9ZZZZ